jgi:hypothetical protein
VLFVQSGPEVLIRASLTLTVVFVNRDPWEGEGADDCVPEGCIAAAVGAPTLSRRKMGWAPDELASLQKICNAQKSSEPVIIRPDEQKLK